MSTRPYLGVNVNPASVEEMFHRGLLDEGEVLLALFDGVLLDEQRRRVGGLSLADFVALTDRRLITWARGFFNDAVDGFAWGDVDVAHAESWDPWHGRVSLAFRLPAVAPRQRRIVVKGLAEDPGSAERVIVNTLDYMPVDDVTALANMVAWVGDQTLAGLAGEPLVAAFAEAFPAPEPKVVQPFFGPVDPAPPPAPAPAAPEQPRRWWQRKADEAETPTLTPPASPADLIASYESQRGGLPAGDGAAYTPRPAVGPLPTLPEQPSMYEVSRSLRLFLEAPRKLARGLRRASEAMGGANELLSGMQDPQVRRTAMRGLYAAAAQQEAENGPLAPVGPVVRAAVRFTEPLEPEAPEVQRSRRIQMRPAEPQRQPPRRVAAETATPEAQAADAPLRRSISVRRVEPPVDEAAAEPAAPYEAPAEAPRAPVRRIALSRADNRPPAVVSPNGNGRHHEDDEAEG